MRILQEHMPVRGKNIAVLGLAFKPDTDDIREASSLKIVDQLIKKGANVRAYDPQAMPNFKKVFPDIDYRTSAEDCVSEADAVMIVTEWKDFSDPALYGNKLVVDGRGVTRTKNYDGICW